MKKVLIGLLAIASFSSYGSVCGKAVGLSYNQDTIERPYRLSGFFIKQNTSDIRITYGNSPRLIEDLEDLNTSVGLFTCLDEYDIKEKTYAGKKRFYGVAREYRVWLDGELMIEKD